MSFTDIFSTAGPFSSSSSSSLGTTTPSSSTASLVPTEIASDQEEGNNGDLEPLLDWNDPEEAREALRRLGVRVRDYAYEYPAGSATESGELTNKRALREEKTLVIMTAPSSLGRGLGRTKTLWSIGSISREDGKDESLRRNGTLALGRARTLEAAETYEMSLGFCSGLKRKKDTVEGAVGGDGDDGVAVSSCGVDGLRAAKDRGDRGLKRRRTEPEIGHTHTTTPSPSPPRSLPPNPKSPCSPKRQRDAEVDADTGTGTESLTRTRPSMPDVSMSTGNDTLACPASPTRRRLSPAPSYLYRLHAWLRRLHSD